ncbi:OmpA family protein [Roseateles sp. DC23W]|uniref:OmpA family protein n=1 Tax=Pelomonas dachongensis TaxID=3299029 RepID=A0ABW7EGL9_9BURK
MFRPALTVASLLPRLIVANIAVGAALGHAQVEISPVAGFDPAPPKVVEYDKFAVRVQCKQPTCKLGALLSQDGKLVLEGRVEERTHVRSKGAALVSDLQVARELGEALAKTGYTLQNPESGRSGPFVFSASGAKGQRKWVILNDNFEGYYTVVQVTSQARGTTVAVSASDMAAQMQADGWATLYIEFDTGRAALKPDGAAVVDEIVKLLQLQPKLKLSIEGHTDNVGEPASNRKLSLERAQAVQKALYAKGIAAARLSVAGHGPDIPVADNRKDEGRAKNRRVELVKLP